MLAFRELPQGSKALGVVIGRSPSHYINAALDPQHGAPADLHAPFRSLLESGVPFALGSDGPSNHF